MAQVCYICNKLKQVGRQSRHHKGVAGKQWAKRAQETTKVFKPNLHPKTINGVRMILCAKCIKRIKAEQLAQQEEVKETSQAATA
ncbi:MAG: large ribosomal subunit protein bL28 [Patescibacteria group bacterium]|jgi:ribosomal protein L28